MNEFFLVVHILSAAAWIGGGFLAGFVGPRIARHGPEASLGWARVISEAAAKYFNPAGILTLLSGAALVIWGDAYDWADTFVSVGLGVVVVSALIGAFALRPASGRIISALESRQYGDAASAGKTAAIWGVVNSGLLIVAVVVMVLKTGAG